MLVIFKRKYNIECCQWRVKDFYSLTSLIEVSVLFLLKFQLIDIVLIYSKNKDKQLESVMLPFCLERSSGYLDRALTNEETLK